MRRVLKPGSRSACVEQVEAPAGSVIHRMQRLIRQPWKWVFAGCDLCRDTGATLRSSGFAQVNVQSLVLPAIFVPIPHQIAKICVKSPWARYKAARPQGRTHPAMASGEVHELPLDFVLDDSTAMTPDAHISSRDQGVPVARASKSGNARPGPDDLEGTAGAVQMGANSVRVRIDRGMP